MRYEKNRCMGLTMLELMIVITIIVVLAAILLPALIGAKRSALMTDCIGKMRQMKTGWKAYAAENNGYMVPYRHEDSDPADWWERLGPTFISEVSKKVTPSNYHENFISGIFVCSEDYATYEKPNETGMNYDNKYIGRKFGINHRGSFVYNEWIRTNDPDKYPRRLRDLPNSEANTPILTEAYVKAEDCGFGSNVWNVTNKSIWPNFHDQERVNILFADGAAKSMKKDKATDLMNKYGKLEVSNP